jgi:NAD(P)-dependent dehydrogenase (short-subunit alcohol dehydrogenase family)
MGERLKDKVCIITGGTSGIGKGAVELFAEEGASVVFVGRRAPLGEKVESDLTARGLSVKYVQGDMTISADRERLVNTALDAFGRINVLYNNAAISIFKTFEEIGQEEADLIFDINFRSVFAMCKLVVPIMKKQGGGSIVNTASIGGMVGTPTLVAYSCSKGAIRMLTKGLASEVVGDNIRVNSLVPGFTLTEMTENDPEFVKMTLEKVGLPMNRGAKPREIALGALYLASDESGFMTASELTLDGGFCGCRL